MRRLLTSPVRMTRPLDLGLAFLTGSTSLFLILVMLIAYFGTSLPSYFSLINLQQMAREFAEPALVTLAITPVLLSRGIDLSVGSMFALSVFSALYLLHIQSVPIVYLVPIMAVVGLALGGINGTLVAVLKAPPFLATLATLIIMRAGYDLLASRFSTELAIATGYNEAWEFLGSGLIFGVPVSVLILGLVFSLMVFVFARTRIGIHIRAVGADPTVARRAGISISRSQLLTYLFCGLLTAVAGLLYAARQDSAASSVGMGLEILVLTSAVLGGISLSGGRGDMLGALLGAAVLFTLTSGLLRMGFPGSTTAALSGALLLLTIISATYFGQKGTSRRNSPGSDLHAGAAQSPAVRPRRDVASQNGTPLVEIREGEKFFSGKAALKKIDFSARAGEVHAIMGRNGAGKSTLAKIICADDRLDSGSIIFNSDIATPTGESGPIRCGVTMIYQEPNLIPSLTIAQNIFLGRETSFTVPAEQLSEAAQALSYVGLSVPVSTPVEQLSLAEKRLVEIARAAHFDARIVILDEPIAGLNAKDHAAVFRYIGELKEQGVAVVLISHSIDDVRTFADRVSVLDEGEIILRRDSSELGSDELEALFAHPGQAKESARAGSRKDVPSELTPALTFWGSGFHQALQSSVSFSLNKGEILALFQQSEDVGSVIGALIAGATRKPRGASVRMTVNGIEIDPRAPMDAIKQGIAHASGDRDSDGFFGNHNLDDNVYLSALLANNAWRWRYSSKESRDIGDTWVKRLGIRFLERTTSVTRYSGGNQQKVVIARALAKRPDILILDEPTRGVDISAVPQIQALIEGLASEGVSIIIISSRYDEISCVADRTLSV